MTLACALNLLSVMAQVGINTATPKAALDIESDSYGVVMPRFALSSTLNESPVSNPQGGTIPAGTVIYNTATTSTGLNDVSPGLYVWYGTQWDPQFSREDYALFKQSAGCQRTAIQSGALEYGTARRIEGLVEEIFIPKYSGMYRIEVKTNYGSGKIEDFTSGDESYISLSTSEGAFFFKFEGNGRILIDPESTTYDYAQGWSYTHSYSAQSDHEATTIESYNVPHYATLVYYKPLIAGTPYTFNLRHKIVTGASVFQNAGASGDGLGHVGHDIPCSVEFEFLGN